MPRLLQLLQDRNTKSMLRIEAAITVGSLAKGTNEHVEILINSGTIQLLLNTLEENEPQLIDACLSCLRTLSQSDSPQNKIDVKRLHKLLTFAGPGESLRRQACVASIMGSACKTPVEQNELCAMGAPNLLAALLSVQNSSVRIPVLACLASMCWNNQNVANMVANTTYKDVKVSSILATLIGRDRPIEMQLEAARCLTNLHRAGAISSNDPIITYRTLPCLVRLCQVRTSQGGNREYFTKQVALIKLCVQVFLLIMLSIVFCLCMNLLWVIFKYFFTAIPQVSMRYLINFQTLLVKKL